MNDEKIVKTEAADLPAMGAEGREYRRPEVHDLGKLEQVQGVVSGTILDMGGGYFV